jgi:teichuronic acid biosynthesis glycosyltransferase TuaC
MTRPIRTLLFSTLFPSSVRPVHGVFVETRLRELLRLGGVQTRVLAPVPWFPSSRPSFGDYARYAATPLRETRNGIDVLHPRYPLIPKFGMTLAPLLLAAASVRPVQRIIDEGFDFDLIDAHYFYPDGVAAALLARHFGKPLTITARGTDLNLIPQHALPRKMMHWAAQRADASIGVCRALTDVLREWGLDERKIHVMRNGVDLERFAPLPQQQARQQLGLADGPVLLSVGHLIERKGHHLAVQAMPGVLERHPTAQLFIVGEGEERQRLLRMVEQLGLQARVRLVGAVPNEKMGVWYSAADALVLASSREGWANVLLEAMACGTPVVASDIWGTPEVVAAPVAGRLVAQRTGAAFAHSLLALLAQAPDRAAVRRYAEGFGWGETSRRQLELFSRLAAAGPTAQVVAADA